MATTDFQSELELLSKRSIPLVAITTLDAPATEVEVYQVGKARQGKGVNFCTITWDFLLGPQGFDSTMTEFLQSVFSTRGVEAASFAGQGGLPNWLEFIHTQLLVMEMRVKWFLVFRNAHRYVEDPSVAQGFCLLRTSLAATGSMAILMGPTFAFPTELRTDIYTLDYALPKATELQAKVGELHAIGGLPAPTADIDNKAVKATEGLSLFAAEQAISLALRKDGLDIDALWGRKHQMIDGNPGLKIYRGKETYKDIGGCENAKSYFTRLLAGPKSPACIVFIDEIEKSIGGSKQDTSGVSQDFLGQFLSYMQDNDVTGSIFLGPPGAAKSALAKATGNEGQIPTISLDLGGLKDSLVGSSEKNLRQALKVISAVSQGNSLWLATCNQIGGLPPELRRRFRLATFFFDLPTQEERGIIWDLYLNKYALRPEQFVNIPASEGWTGAEIQSCCDVAWRLNCTLEDAAAYVVPVAVSAASQIEALRTQAHGKFIAASQPGVYFKPEVKTAIPSRQLDLTTEQSALPPVAVMMPNFTFIPSNVPSQPVPAKEKIGFDL